jgi:pimeloyl-ACP methyl ester carboxylesterase
MEYVEFGKNNKDVLMLLHGNLMSWRQFKECIPFLEGRYHVVAVSFDGFDDTGKTTYSGAEKVAGKLAEYIKENFDGHISTVFAESLGCGPAVCLKANKAITVDNIVLSGAECMDLGILNALFLKIMPQKQYKMATDIKNGTFRMPGYLKKITGRTDEALKKWSDAIPANITLESVVETWKVGLNMYRIVDKMEVQKDANVACWYGEKEMNMKRAIKKLSRVYPKLQVNCFKGYGHGEIIDNPERLSNELIKFLKTS